jgi:hypothetical protein
MTSQLKYGDIIAYLKTYSTEEPPYDFNGLLRLVLAGVDNLQKHAIDQDFRDFACAVTDEQALFLRRLLDSRQKSISQIERDE